MRIFSDCTGMHIIHVSLVISKMTGWCYFMAQQVLAAFPNRYDSIASYSMTGTCLLPGNQPVLFICS